MSVPTEPSTVARRLSSCTGLQTFGRAASAARAGSVQSAQATHARKASLRERRAEASIDDVVSGEVRKWLICVFASATRICVDSSFPWLGHHRPGFES